MELYVLSILFSSLGLVYTISCSLRNVGIGMYSLYSTIIVIRKKNEKKQKLKSFPSYQRKTFIIRKRMLKMKFTNLLKIYPYIYLTYIYIIHYNNSQVLYIMKTEVSKWRWWYLAWQGKAWKRHVIRDSRRRRQLCVHSYTLYR